MAYYRNNRFSSPRTYSAADLVAVVVVAIRALSEGVRWVSAATAEQTGAEATGRVLARRAEGLTVTDADRAEVLALAARVASALRDSSRSFDQSLASVAGVILRGTSISIPGALSVAAYLPFWKAMQDAREANRPAPESGFAGLLSLFGRAAESLRFPKITFANLPGIGTVKIQRAASGKNAGGLNITDGRPFGSNRFFGALTATGDFRPGRDLTPEIRDFLSRLAADPANVAAEYGRGSGACCFCNTTITTAESMAVGYGPICAGHYGLPWGAAQ